MGRGDGRNVGSGEGSYVWVGKGLRDGAWLGGSVGKLVGDCVGVRVGAGLGALVGSIVGIDEGKLDIVGRGVGCADGSGHSAREDRPPKTMFRPRLLGMP